MKNTTMFLAIFCLISTFAKAQNSCNSCRTGTDRYDRCRVNYASDIPLTTATPKQLDEINQIYNRLSDRILGEEDEDRFIQRRIDAALSNYNKLNIEVVNGNISGNITGGIHDPDKILRVFAQHIKFRPTADNIEDIKQKASNLVWLILKKNCDGSLPIVLYYDYREFMKPVTFLLDYISDDSKMGFYNLLYNFNGLGAFYGDNYSEGDGIFNADMMRSSGISLTGYAKFINDDNEKVRWMKGITRLMNRSFTYSNGGAGGIKPDGSGFHHLFSYPTYMGASYTTCIDIIVSLDKTSFQISRDSYLRFRDAVYYQRLIGNDGRGMKAFSMSGRFPDARHLTDLSVKAIGDLAIIGGKILGLTTADPVLAGYYNRVKKRTDPELNYTKVTPFEEGYIQFNHTEGAIYRKDDYLVFFNGFSSSTFGIEAFEGNNLFGRYQSYGAMEIIVPGYTDAEDNGFSTSTWNWNYNPGTTTIVLPWKDLEKKQNYGSQQKRFVGSLSLKNKGNPALTKVFGTYGLFAMDFQEARNKNPTFIFKKSNFTFSDMIVCLGSDINNNNTRDNTVTTLYQRLANSRSVTVNGTVVQEEGLQTFTGNNNWVISNANNGFYVVNGGDIKVWSGSSPTGNHQSDPGNITLTTDFKPNTYGYIDHGTSPSNVGYEYICTPKTTVEKMTDLHTKMQNPTNRPYIVHQKNANAHIVEHKKDKIWGYSLFSTNSNINHTGSIIKGNDKPCLVMYQKADPNNILLSVTNPDWGFDGGWNGKSEFPIVSIDVRLTLSGEWLLSLPNPGAKLISSNISETILEFNLVDGLPVEIQVVKTNKVLAANAGDDQIVDGGVVVTLDGSSSSDPKGGTLTYSWTQTSGTPTVTLSDTTVAMPTFTAPQLTTNTELVFSLKVTDSKGTTSPEDSVIITVTRSLDNFITTWTVTGSDKSITFPGSGSYTINWGDESTVESATGNISHTYANAETYTVTASNGITRFNLNNGASKSKLTSIEQWGTAQWTDMFAAFKGASNMVYNATDTPNLSSVTRMDQMFRSASSFNATNLNSWNVSNIEGMNLLFYEATVFNGDISSWNVSNVTRMNAMFSSAKAFNGDISNWNVSKVTDMRGMFHSTRAFMQNLGRWFITPDTFAVDEGVAANTVVGTITTLGNVLTKPTFTYTISGGKDAGKFSLTSAGGLTIKESPSLSTQESYSIEITADVATDRFGRWGVNFTTTRMVTINALSLRPTVTITSSSGDSGTGTTSATLNYTATFSEAVTGFDIDDITVAGTTNSGNPEASNFVAVTGGTTYTFDVERGFDGTVSVSIASDVATTTNSYSNFASNIYELTIATIPVLNTPSVSPVGYNPMEELSIQFSAYGASPLIFSLTGDAPEGLTIDETSGLLTWTPTESQVGTYSVTVTVSNSLGEDSETIIITVGIDTDGDGVFDSIDTCPNTPSGESVNAVGCIQLPPNNFEISSTTPSCPNVNNGKISIKNLSSHTFNFVVTGPNSYNKTFLAKKPFVIENLAVGVYNITAKFSTSGIGQDITGFQTIISSATPVSGANKSIDIVGKSSVFTVSGDKKYSIYINDVFQRSETFSDEGQYKITVNNLSVGENHIKIVPENKCRGLIEGWITIPNSNVKFYPNPAIDLFHIGGLESSDITVQIFAYNGQRVYNKNHKSVNGIVYFSIRDLPAGLYIIRVFGKQTGDNINFKITKN